MSQVPDITLDDGTSIPQLGFGVYQIPPAQTAEAVRATLDIGYRHIDTAQMYGNEARVGQGIRDAGLARDQVWFVTSKAAQRAHRRSGRPPRLRRHLAALGSTTSICSSSIGRCPPVTTATSRPPGRCSGSSPGRPGPQHRVSNFTEAQLDTLAAGSSTIPGGEPDRGAPYHANDGVRACSQSPRHRHRGLVAHRPGSRCSTTRPSPRSPAGGPHPWPRWCCAGTSSAVTLCS